MKLVARVAVVALACFALAGCGLPSKSVSGTVVQRIQSPNGAIDALVTRSDVGGATVSTAYRVYLETKSDGLNHQVLKADKAGPISVTWQDNNHLSINVACAQIFSYTNFFDVLKSGNLVYQVSIRLQNQGLCSVHASKQQGTSSGG